MSTEIVNKLMATPFAFPHSVELSDGSSFHSPGMTLRDYFADKAPREPEFWFVANLSSLGERPVPVYEQGECDNPFSQPTNSEELSTWELASYKLRFFQWRYAYADEMLKAREA
jgi:hypothetical protein